MRVPTLNMQISANIEYYTSMKFTGEKKNILHQMSHHLAIHKKMIGLKDYHYILL